MTSLLALDCSRYCGWAYFSGPAAKPRCRTWQAKDTWLSEEYGSYFDETERWLLDMLATFSPDVLAFESPLLLPRHDGRGTDEQQVRRLIGVVSIIEKVAFQRKLRCMEVNVQSAKSFMGVPGRRPKEMSQADYKSAMVVAVTARGFDAADSHQADAIAVALCVYSDLGELET